MPDDFRARLAALDTLVVVSLVWFLAKFLRYAFPPLFATFRDIYGVTDATLGIAFSAMMLCYAATQFPSGALADRVGAVRVIVGGAVLAAVGALFVGAGIGAVAGLAGITAAMVLIGVGTGAHKTVAVPLLSRAYDRRGRALGALDTFGSFGGAAAPAVVVALAASPALGWETLFLGAGAAGLALAGGVALRVPQRLPAAAGPTAADPDRAPDSGDGSLADGLRRYAEPFRAPRLLGFVGVTVLFSFAYNGVIAFLPLYLVAETALSSTLAGLTYSALFLVSVVQPATGAAADRWGELPVVVLTLAVATAGLAGLLAVRAAVPAILATVALGVGSHGFRPVRGAYLVELAPGAAAGGTLGVTRTALMAAGALAPGVVGVVAAATDYRVAFALLLGCLVAAVAGAGWLYTAERV